MKKIPWKKIINEFEIYIGAVLFAIMTVILFAQVVSRYVFNHSITWAEELATMMFVWMVYLGCAGAITKRKHLSIEAFVTAMPFKVRKVLLIIDDIIFAVFAIYLIFPMMAMVQNYAAKGAVSAILRFPKAVSYGVMPFCMALIAIRTIPDIIKLAHEQEHELGQSQPTLDMAALEAEAAERKAKEEKKGAEQ